MLKIVVILLFSTVIFIGVSASVVDAIYGGGEPFPDRTTPPSLDGSELIKIADLDFPPGNIAVAPNGAIFFTFHPEGRPPYNLAELVDGVAQPLKIKNATSLNLRTVLSMRIDQQNRLWVLDYADHGQGTPQIAAIDLTTREVVHHHKFSSDIAPLGSHLNDFQVDAAGRRIYIADASILGLDSAIVVYDVETQTARRLLEDHSSVSPDLFVPYVEGEKMLMFGVFAIRPGVDSIALDKRNEWLYFAPVTDDQLHRVRISDLNNPTLSEDDLESLVESFGAKTMSDGITIDNEDRLYLSDMEHSAIVRMNSRGELTTLIKDKKLRWPDGFSFGPDNELYVTASALQYVIAKPDRYIQENGPYQIYKLKVDATAVAGH
jgi:sugar lactone lactonase YvrE